LISDEMDREYERIVETETPILVSEVLSGEEELILELRGGPGRVAPATNNHADGPHSELTFVVRDSSVEEPNMHAGEVTGTDDRPVNTDDGEAVLAETGESSTVVSAKPTISTSIPTVADTGPAQEDLGSSFGQLLLDPPLAVPVEIESAAVETDYGPIDSDAVERHQLINSESEQASFGPGQKKRCAIIKGDGKFGFPIVGESHYQAELGEIARARGDDLSRRLVAALLVPEPNNFFDRHAVAVQIDKRTVGYLSFQSGPVLLKALADGKFDCAACAAAVFGPPARGRGGEFRVKLDASLPFVMVERPQELRPGRQDRSAAA
jgi:hypothetical protein